MMRKAARVIGLGAAVAAWRCGKAGMVNYKANLAGPAEVPPVTTGGKGTAAVNVDSATKQVTWRVEYSRLGGPATAAHIHFGAAAGANARGAVPLGKASASPITRPGAVADPPPAPPPGGQGAPNRH